MWRHVIGLLWLASSVAASAGEIVLPAADLERGQVVTALYRTSDLASGKGTLALRWTDVPGRVVEDWTLPVELTDENEIRFPLDMRRAVAMKNTLAAHFVFDGVNRKGASDHRDEQAQVNFIARPGDRDWKDYRIIMWQDYPANLWKTLMSLGINAGQYVGRSEPPADFLLDNDLQWYAENIATDFYSAYHRYFPDRRVNWKFYEAKELYKKDPSSKEAFKRHPSFSDPAWVDKIHDRLVSVTRKHSRYRPIFYDLGDESGVGDLAAFWDFDFSDQSLAEMRDWLKQRYGTLAALNRQWGTRFSGWDLVTPETTNEAMKRTDGNFSSWADHKEWMDISYARALQMGADAVHSVDAKAYVGIAGAQMPGWGGYDYARLSVAVNFFEPYDIGNNIEIIRSLAPGTPVVTTSFARGPWEKHRVWYELLHGNRGLIIWDDKFEFVNRDGTPGPRGVEAAPYFNEIAKGIGALLINSTRLSDPIAIHYSQASFRTDWMLRHQPRGSAWVDRTSSSERLDSEFLRLRESYCRLIEDLGLQYRFVSYSQLEQGELSRGGYRVLILPDSLALSAAEVGAIRGFLRSGGRVIATGDPGGFDEHSRKLATPQLNDVRDQMIRIPGDALNYHRDRLLGKEGSVLEAARSAFQAAEVRPRFRVVDERGQDAVGVETHMFRNGGATIVGLLTNPDLRVDELGPPEFKSNARFEKPRHLRVLLDTDAYVYDVRKAQFAGRQNHVEFTLDPYEPVVYALLPSAARDLHVAVPGMVPPGGTAPVSFSTDPTAATSVFRVEVTDPSGNIATHYSGNFFGTEGRGGIQISFAVNDTPGKWDVRVRDVLTGKTARSTIEVQNAKSQF
jgi:glycosyl hydrolase family 42 (putative beta-galactosidase)